MWCDMRSRIRIREEYYAGGFEQRLKNIRESKPAYSDAEFIQLHSSPSFNKLVDNLRKAERDKFWELFKDEYSLDTIIPGVGFKTKHKYSKDLVYVLDMGSYGETKQGIDPTRERLRIYKRSNTTDLYMRNITIHGTMREYLRQCAWHAKEQYIDNLTKKQREAIMFIRMLPEYELVEGLGAHVGDNFILDC